MKQLVNRAASGEHRALQILINYLHDHEKQAASSAPDLLIDEADQEIINGISNGSITPNEQVREKTTMAKSIITIDEYQALLRVDFYAFIERCFLQLNPQTRFYRNWHLEVMAARLEAWRQGKIRRLIINVPPRHLKSHCASIALAAWISGTILRLRYCASAMRRIFPTSSRATAAR